MATAYSLSLSHSPLLTPGQGCHNLLTLNPKEHTPNTEIIMENTVPNESRRLKNPNLQYYYYMLMKQN